MTILENEIFPYSSLLFFRQETVRARDLNMNYMMGTVKVSVNFNRANALSLREYVALMEVKSEHGEKTYGDTFILVTSGVCLLKQLCCLNDIKLFVEKDCRSIEELNEER
jgi:hypothetical protein